MGAIHASQHPHVCNRLLLVEDDLPFSGLGYTSVLWRAALLVAMRAGRVLIEVPLDISWYPSQAVRAPRWCTVPPFTLQCFYVSAPPDQAQTTDQSP